MEFLAVLVAAVASYIFGALWYMMLAKPWMAAAQVPVGPDGRPANAGNPTPYIVAFLGAVLVAGMMRHVFVTGGVDTVGKGLLSGLGLGLFVATPWIASNIGFGGKSWRLLPIDGGYATIGCGIIGLVLALFGVGAAEAPPS